MQQKRVQISPHRALSPESKSPSPTSATTKSSRENFIDSVTLQTRARFVPGHQINQDLRRFFIYSQACKEGYNEILLELFAEIPKLLPIKNVTWVCNKEAVANLQDFKKDEMLTGDKVRYSEGVAAHKIQFTKKQIEDQIHWFGQQMPLIVHYAIAQLLQNNSGILSNDNILKKIQQIQVPQVFLSVIDQLKIPLPVFQKIIFPHIVAREAESYLRVIRKFHHHKESPRQMILRQTGWVQFADPRFPNYDANTISGTHFVAAAGPQDEKEVVRLFEATVFHPEKPIENIAAIGTFGKDFYNYCLLSKGQTLKIPQQDPLYEITAIGCEKNHLDLLKDTPESLSTKVVLSIKNIKTQEVKGLTVYNFNVKDMSKHDLTKEENFRRFCEVFDCAMDSDVLIHCKAGVGRACHTIFSYVLAQRLILAGGDSLDMPRIIGWIGDLLEHKIRQNRPSGVLNDVQFDASIQMAFDIRDRTRQMRLSEAARNSTSLSKSQSANLSSGEVKSPGQQGSNAEKKATRSATEIGTQGTQYMMNRFHNEMSHSMPVKQLAQPRQGQAEIKKPAQQSSAKVLPQSAAVVHQTQPRQSYVQRRAQQVMQKPVVTKVAIPDMQPDAADPLIAQDGEWLVYDPKRKTYTQKPIATTPSLR